jgi:hypothetical protein
VGPRASVITMGKRKCLAPARNRTLIPLLSSPQPSQVIINVLEVHDAFIFREEMSQVGKGASYIVKVG